MYSYGEQPVDAPYDGSGHSHSNYPQAAESSDLDHQSQLCHESDSYYYFVNVQASQNSGDHTSTAFPNEPFSNPNFPAHYQHYPPAMAGGSSSAEPPAFQSADLYPDLNFVNLHTNLRDHYDLVMTGTDKDPGLASFVNDPFQFTVNPHADSYHPMYNPSAIPGPYQGFGSLNLSYPLFPPPVVSVDRMTTLAPDSEDIPPLGEPPHIDEPLPLGDSFSIREPSSPPRQSGSHIRQPPEKKLDIKFWSYLYARPKMRGLTTTQSQIHRKIFGDTRMRLIQSALSTCPFLTEQERKTAAHEVLISAANVYDEEYRNEWGTENITTFYKMFAVQPSAEIMSTCKKITHSVAQFGYCLRPPIWSDELEPQHQIDKVKELIDDPLFPLRFIFGNDSSNRPADNLEVFAFENPVVSYVAMNTILILGWVPYVTMTGLDSLFCTAAAAVHGAIGLHSKPHQTQPSIVNVVGTIQVDAQDYELGAVKSCIGVDSFDRTLEMYFCVIHCAFNVKFIILVTVQECSSIGNVYLGRSAGPFQDPNVLTLQITVQWMQQLTIPADKNSQEMQNIYKAILSSPTGTIDNMEEIMTPSGNTCLGHLLVTLGSTGLVSNYARWLDLDEAVSHITWCRLTTMLKEIFSSPLSITLLLTPIVAGVNGLPSPNVTGQAGFSSVLASPAPTGFWGVLKPENVNVNGPLEPEDTDISAKTLCLTFWRALMSPRHCDQTP
ncbi:hypothetical protein F4604DRAFT_1688427 [Suillus subluteus]|nr:hypothetical protein F4604DRAFT_1688427 [Suillus subluteus]